MFDTLICIINDNGCVDRFQSHTDFPKRFVSRTHDAVRDVGLSNNKPQKHFPSSVRHSMHARRREIIIKLALDSGCRRRSFLVLLLWLRSYQRGKSCPNLLLFRFDSIFWWFAVWTTDCGLGGGWSASQSKLHFIFIRWGVSVTNKWCIEFKITANEQRLTQRDSSRDKYMRTHGAAPQSVQWIFSTIFITFRLVHKSTEKHPSYLRKQTIDMITLLNYCTLAEGRRAFNRIMVSLY